MDRYDNERNYCRMLGHEIAFHYCRTVAQGIPCRKIMDCWFESLPMREFIDECYSAEEQERIFREPAPRIASLIGLIEQARTRAQGGQSV
jgi:hypothetical protein